MRICVCGGRDYFDKQKVWDTLDTLKSFVPNFVLVHGDAKGADSLADAWARYNNIETDPYPADWDQYNKAAGPIRNVEMAESNIALLIAFPGGKGTDHMIMTCMKRKIPVKKIK